VNNLGNF